MGKRSGRRQQREPKLQLDTSEDVLGAYLSQNDEADVILRAFKEVDIALIRDHDRFQQFSSRLGCTDRQMGTVLELYALMNIFEMSNSGPQSSSPMFFSLRDQVLSPYTKRLLDDGHLDPQQLWDIYKLKKP